MSWWTRSWAVALPLLIACGSGQEEEASQLMQALTAEQARVFGFETPTADWSSTNGVLAETATRTQGTKALSVVPQGWTEVVSKQLGSLGGIGAGIGYDLRIPAAVPWGETRLIVRVPSRGIGWQDLGIRSLVGLAAGTYHTISFALPPDLVTVLEGTYSDLEFRVVINAPVTASPYLLDNLQFSPDGGGTSSTNFTFSIKTPQQFTPAQMFISTSNRLQVDDRVTLGVSGTLARIANFGSGGLELGSAGFTRANVYNAAGSTQLRSNATVSGFVRAAGNISTQPPVFVTGGQFPNTSTPSQTTSFTVAWPSAPAPGIFLAPDLPPSGEPPLAIAPGAYAHLNVHSRSRVALRAGTYFFDSFNTEPQAQVFLDTSAGSIVIFTRDQFRYHGQFVQSAGPEGQVLVGHRGTSNVDLQVGFVGTVVAPNAQIDVRRPTVGQHKGAFFGRNVQVFSDGTVLHLPFNWSLPCQTPPANLDDGDPCTIDACDLVRGVTHTRAAAGSSCSDGNSCNGGETCTAAGACVVTTPPQSEGASCTSNSACLPGATRTCGAGQVCDCRSTHPSDGNDCTQDIANGDGTFSYVPRPATSLCFLSSDDCDGSARCNGKGFCACSSGEQDDGNSCTADAPSSTPGQFTHTSLPDGTVCPPEYLCSGEGKCTARGFCLCRTPTILDLNPCTEGRCNDLQGCSQSPREEGVLCSGSNFCNGECNAQASCDCDPPPAPQGHPIRTGTFNTQFLPNAPFDALGTGHGFAGCDPDFFGATDHDCLAEAVAPKIRNSDYDFIVLNEVFADTGRDRLIWELQGDLNSVVGPYQFAVEQMDGAGLFGWPPEVEQDSGLMLFSQWPIDDMTPEDAECFEGNEHTDISGKNLDGKAVGFIVFDDTAGDDSWAQKGIGWVRLVAPNGFRYQVFFTHAQASYEDQRFNAWLNDGLKVREKQFTRVVQLMDCLAEKNRTGTTLRIPRAEFLLGDLNINGDLSNPFVDRNDSAELGSTCELLVGNCASLTSSGEIDPTDTCFNNPRAGNATVCRGEALALEKRNHNRVEWDFYFNNRGTPISSHSLHGRALDLWADAMTPSQCIPTSGAADPTCPVTTATDVFGLGLTGPADYDRGITQFDPTFDGRLDYVLMNPNRSSGTEEQCAQHVTTAWNLLVDDGSEASYEGGITPRSSPGRMLGGHQTISDHFGVNAEINDNASFCNPTNALLAPPIEDPVATPTGEIPLKLDYRGAVHWIKVEEPGTYSFNVNPLLQVPFGAAFGDVEFDNGLTYRVYEQKDLSRPIVPLKGEVRSVPPEESCVWVGSEDIDCWEVPGFKEARFHVPQAPFYVKVFHPTNDFSDDWHGEYRFLYRRSRCTSQEEACGLAPFEGVAPNSTEAHALASARTFPANSGEFQWFFFHVDAPDSDQTQALSVTVTEAEVSAEPNFSLVEVLRENTLEPVLTIDTPSVDALGRFVWTAQDTSGLLDITDNPSGADQKYFIRISRRADADDVDVRFWAAWETPLTWLFGPALQGRAAQVRCRDTTDALSEDEVYMQVVADGTRYPLGARHGAATEGAALDTSMDEDDEVEWTGRIFPRLGNNAHGVAFGDQRAIKYVSSLSLQLHEDDDTFTLGDDTSSVNFGPLGPLVGSQAAPDRHWFGTDYRLRGGSMSHERPGKPCQSNTDCEEPLICNGFCRQAQ